MLNIAIISKVSMGFRGLPFGGESEINPFKKSSASKLKESILSYFSSTDTPVSVTIDNYTGDPKNMLKDGVNLILISPHIAKPFLPFDEEIEEYCLVMSEKTYLGGDIEPIIKKVNSLKSQDSTL